MYYSFRLIIVFMLFVSNAVVGMDITPFTFLTEKDQLKVTLPFAFVKQCAIVNNLCEDLSVERFAEASLPNTDRRNALRLVYYLKTLYQRKRCSPSQLSLIQKTDHRLSEYVKNLNSDKLINLACMVDYCEVNHVGVNNYIVDELAARIIKTTPTEMGCFSALDKRAIMRDIVVKIGNKINFEESLIQPYSDALTERHSVPRTMSVIAAIYYNLRNAFTAPARCFGYCPKVITKPYYLNNQTGTIITGWVSEVDEVSKITQLCIGKKNSQEIVTIELSDVAHIKSIEANVDESLFICHRAEGKSFLINKEKAKIEGEFTDCAFSDNADELYVVNGQAVGIFNIATNNFSCVYKDEKCFKGIKTNSNRTRMVAYTDKEVFMGIKQNEGFVIQKLPIKPSQLEIPDHIDAENWDIDNICFHQVENKIYVYRAYHYGATGTREFERFGLFCINVDTLETIQMLDAKSKNDYLIFLSNDILFLGQSEMADDYFVNTKTGNHWTKKKKRKYDLPWQEGFAPFFKKGDNFYEHLALTTDGTLRIERTFEENIVLDCLALYSNSKSSNSERSFFEVKRIAATQLINDNIKNMVQKINTGFLPLEEIKIAQEHSKSTTWKSRLKKAFSFGLACVVVVLNIYASTGEDKNGMKKKMNIMGTAEKLYGLRSSAFIMFLGLFLAKNIVAQY